PAPRRRPSSPGLHPIVTELVIPVQRDEAPGGGRLAELKEAAVSELLLAEVGKPLPHLVLETREDDRPLLGKALDDLVEHAERLLLAATAGELDDRVAAARALGQLDRSEEHTSELQSR